jgi:hypothetical protein
MLQPCQACTLPKGLVRPFKVIGGQSTLSKPKSGPLLSARLCDLDVLWQRAAQLCDISTQHKENMRVIIDGANSGGLLARFNGLSMFVPVSQLGRKGHNEWWTEQVSCCTTCDPLHCPLAGHALTLPALAGHGYGVCWTRGMRCSTGGCKRQPKGGLLDSKSQGE